MKTKSVKYNFIMRSLFTVTTVIAPLIVYPYLTRTLGPVGIGSVNFANSIVWYFTMLAGLGIPNYGIKACAVVRDNKIELSRMVQEILIINIVTTVLSYVLFFVCLFTVPQMRNNKLLFLITSLSILFNTIGVEWLYSSLEKFDYIAIRSIAFKIIMIVAVFIFIKKPEDYIIYGALYILGTVGNNIVNFFNLHNIVSLKPVGNYDFKRHLKPILIYFGMSVATTIYTQMDSTMLGFMKGVTENGYYDAAIKVKSLLVTAIASIGTVLMPRASYCIENGKIQEFDNYSVKALEFVIMVSLAFCIYFALFAENAVLLLSGEQFRASVVPMKIIMASVVFISITNITGFQMLVPLGREKNMLLSSIAGATVNLLVNTALIPEFGASGAAIGTVVAELAVLVVQFIGLKDILPKYLKEVQWAKIITGCILATVATIWLQSVNASNFMMLFLAAIVFFTVYFAVLLLAKENLIQECINTVRRRIKR